MSLQAVLLGALQMSSCLFDVPGHAVLHREEHEAATTLFFPKA